MVEKLPHCLQCVHYFITHDPGRPYGCRAMAFKSQVSPGRVVFKNSGMICQLYSPKKRDLNPSGSKKLA
ncbi:uracil-DNA glycosylase [Desulfopila sp. IMCC35006]|uniref:uracil-DNA glycosylase n=1 Tax=Desulfopila sp. IMCC35006 TaxID=2569542 RepID=UPI0010ACCED2|nr:uracil-DNA glycosylase [Desulfopila sp. IMCC35006]TKB27985.1 uracil-DNA glycosylase [Desulfopila sp. IMCC35006]